MDEKQRTVMLIIALSIITLILGTVFVMYLPGVFDRLANQSAPIIQESTVTTFVDETVVDINTADKKTLMMLPEMTEDLAVNIIEYRETHRRFVYLEDLLKVNGVTEELFETWYPMITLN